jgi:tRNA A-37 threonylcarbamoyl transferase component Bud32
MKHFSHVLRNLEQLREFLANARPHADRARSVLVQIYAAEMEQGAMQELVGEINRQLPGGVVVGATTCGELAAGRTLFSETVIGLSFFDSTAVHPIILECAAGEEERTGAELTRRIGELEERVAAVLLLSTPLSIDVSLVLRAMTSEKADYPVFGGGAADYGAMARSFLLNGTELRGSGVIAVALTGSDLHIESKTYLGWHPLSKEMTVTAVDGMVVKTVDGAPAFEVYRRHLGIPDDENFYTNTLEFPFLFERDGLTVSRAPVSVDREQGIQFVADIAEGERFRVGYGNPDRIIAEASAIQGVLREFSPEAIFLFTCSCRRFFLLGDVELETLPFEDVAPTFGFYTYGEFFGRGAKLHLLNSTMVAVGLREGPPRARSEAAPGPGAASRGRDPLSNTHVKVVSRLVHFIGAVTDELEETNQHLKAKKGELEALNAVLEERVATQVEEIVRRAREVEVLNAQLMERVQERSRELSSALARLAKASGGPESLLGPGARLGGRVTIAALLGKGGMGEVYQGHDSVTNQQVAVKVMQAASLKELDNLQRFLQEARAASSVQHPAIVKTLHVDVSSGGELFQIQELIVGKPLDRVLGEERALEAGVACRLGAVLSEALAAAHEAGIVHRDVKPANVILTETGAGLKLLDFGVSKMREARGEDPKFTAAGGMVGTPAFMAPEQISDPTRIRDRTDVYATGMVIYHALAGRSPFRARSAPLFLAAHMVAEPEPLAGLVPGIPGELAALVHRALAKNPDERPSAAELAVGLHTLADALGAAPLPVLVGALTLSPQTAPSEDTRTTTGGT